MKILHCITFTLLLMGGLNWGLFALMGWDISEWFGGMNSQWAKIIYFAVGISAVIEIATHAKNCKTCGKSRIQSGSPVM